jgi:hypothetical protein
MKNMILMTLVALATLTACNKDTKISASDKEALQARLNSDPEVDYTRSIFSKYCRIIASFEPVELQEIYTTLKGCGYITTTPTIPEIEKCLVNSPHKDQYIQGETLLREYEQKFKSIEKRYPELAQMTARNRASMIIQISDQLPEEILSDFQSKNKK